MKKPEKIRKVYSENANCQTGVIISLTRYEHKNTKRISTKFIKKSLMDLTVTVEYQENGTKKDIFSNFDEINCTILGKNQAVT